MQDFDTGSQTITDLLNSVDTLAEEFVQKEKELNNAEKQEQDKILALRAIPSVFPVNGTISSRFEYRRNPFGRGYEFHTGVDKANSRGTPIKAAADGIVVHAGWDSGGYGNLVMIDHGNGYVSLYGHNSKIAVTVGEKVERGQVVSYMGSTGRSTGNHCHFEVRYHGKPISPYSIKQ
jgi:murein DD-endopeptidase MepM/ murein hydrolase activator NlpD